jgi:hypothetical protein
LQVGVVLDAVGSRRRRSRERISVTFGPGQPETWTLIESEVRDEDANRLADSPERSLRQTGGWYCDFRSADETLIVFADRTIRYPRGDPSGRAAAVDYGRSVEVPEAQLDWPY